MKKVNKKLVIIGLLIILLLAGIGAIKLYAVTGEFGLADLLKREEKDGSTVFCIAHNYTIKSGSTYNFTRDNIIEIEGKTATNGNKTTTNKSNAILAYICRAASNENIDNYTRDSNLNYDNRYTKTPSQNAIWDYWDVWYERNGSSLGIRSIYNKKSTPNHKDLAGNVLDKANEYYSVLMGNDGIDVVTSNSSGIIGTTYDHYGPFKIKKTNSRVYGNLYIQTDENILGFVTSIDNKNATSSINFGDSNYKTFYIRVKKGYTTSKFENVVSYQVKQYNARLELFSYYSQEHGQRFQNLAKVTTELVRKTINLDLEVKNVPGVVSVQKLIVDSGMNITPTTRNNRGAIKITDGSYDSTERENKKATSNSGIDISRGRTAGTFNGGKTKKENPYMIKKGEYVVYKIDVYNNSNTDDVTCRVKDRIDEDATLIGIFDNHDGSLYYNELTPTTNENDLSNEKCYYNYGEDNQYYKWNASVNKMGRNDTVAKANSFYVILQYNDYTNYVLSNKVYVTGSKKSETYQTEDYDYVKFQRVDVSLQKYITKVNGTSVESSRKSTKTREDDDIKDQITSTISARDYYKRSNPVPIELGDHVTYRIYVYNNSNVAVDKILLKDVLPYYLDSNGNVQSYVTIDSIYKDGNTRTDIKNDWNPDQREDGTWINSNGLRYIIENLAANKTTYFDITVHFNVAYSTKILTNSAWISSTNPPNQATYRTTDRDYVQMQQYAVSLEKYVYSVNGINQNRDDRDDIDGLGTVYSKWEADKAGNQTITKDNDKTTWCGTKWRNPATANKGDIVTYEIIVKNDGNTAVNVKEIVDTIDKDNFESAFSCEANYNGTILNNTTSPLSCSIEWQNKTKGEILISNNVTIQPGEELKIYLTGTIKTSNMSLDVINNRAKIISDRLINKNNVAVKDSTEYDNMDEDYIQMGDITISGTVWNDKASNKTSDNYNGLYDSSKENALDGIKVYLYRQGVKSPIATTTTSNGGKYSFSAGSLASNNSLKGTNDGNGQFIKAPMQYNHWGKIDDNGTNKLKALAEIVGVGESEITSRSKSTFAPNSDYKNYGALSAAGYYSYYVVFEYDGITYTSTTFADVTSNNSLDSNAKEDGAKVRETRNTFNSRFSTINNASGITYTTKNENGYIPQSIHEYNANTMAMQSSTNIINLSNDDNLVSKLQHVNLGLRGRDIFDLELTSDVYSTKVTVNKQEGAYNFNSNRVTVRESDISVIEDAANFASEARDATISEVNQGIRKTDIYNDKYAVNGTKGNTGLGIEVTYKITVTNASKTDGTATKITNYYDSKYDFVRAYSGASNLTTSVGDSGTGFKSVIIETPATNLSQGNSMDIYVVYRLKDASTTLSVLLGDGEKRLATYNMAEITEYRTQCASRQTEYTRGLLDKDSAPGSANTEQVRLVPNTIGTSTTVQYYFNKKLDTNKDNGDYLKILKYEDDTYATPTLYFVTPGNRDDDGDENDYSRIIEGIVFEDYTSINSNRVKSGNGIKDGKEPIIKGITVKLIEGSTVRDTTTTDEKGYYQFKDFLPGNYTIKYYYGDTEATFLKTAPNKESYNGEDFQATNNSYDVPEIDVHKLSTRDNFWYLDNEREGISTGTDDETRRNTVSSNVTAFTDEQMTNLNKVRDEEQLTDIGSMGDENSLIGQTYMYANTRNMLFTVEKSEINGSDAIQKSQFGTYTISNMNFGIAEAPITKIDLQKHVESFAIKDSTGNNTIASALKDDAGNWELQGDVIAPEGTNTLDVSIEDEKLQGARLQVTYAITSQINAEKNFDGKELAYATITELVDYIDNNLSYNSSLGKNSDYWEITERNSIFTDPNVQGTVDPEGKLYTTIVKAKKENPILNSSGGTATITLEKVLSSSDSTFDEIVTSSVDIYAYSNTVEITGMSYGNTTPEDTDPTPGGTDPTIPEGTDPSTPRKDLVRTPDRYIIIPKEQNDSTSSEVITIHPPTGDSSINILYYVIATVSLVILAIGAFGIRKFVVKKNKE